MNNEYENENEMENENEGQENNSSGKIILIPSTKKFIVAGKVITMSSRKEAEAIAGEEISKEELKSMIVTGVKQNGEKKVEEKNNKVKKFIKNKILPIAVALALVLGMAKGCSQDVSVNQPTFETIAVCEVIYDVDNPYPILEGIINSFGQEGMTANAQEGNPFSGAHYNSNEQADAEQRASQGIMIFVSMKDEIDKNIQILTSPTSSQAEKSAAASRLLELTVATKEIFEKNEDFAKEYAKRFAEASLAYKDSNSENEIATVNLMVENYMAEMGLSSKNVKAIQNIVDAFEQGYEFELEGKKLADGDYLITGEGVREVAENEGVNPSDWQKFKNFLKGDREMNVNKDTNDIEK